MLRIILPILVLLISCTKNDSEFKNSYHIEEKNPNAASVEELQNINPVLLISLDGYRHDYTKKYSPKFLSQFAKSGTQLKSLVPAYPTKTFPNHLSIATGRYPMNHGIVANHFYAPDLNQSYSLRDRKAVKNSDFYLATPIWSAVEEQGLRSATLFWPGSEAEISGQRPSYWYDYIHTMPHEARTKQIIEWLKLPQKERPYFITLYFPDVDSAGHHYGTNSKEVKEAILKVDKTLESFIATARKIVPNLNIIIVSDHGMKDVDENKKELILKNEELLSMKEDYRIYGSGPIVQFYLKENKRNISQDISSINKLAQNFKCFDKDSTPEKLHFRSSPRVGNFACIAQDGYWIAATEFKMPKASHGWDQYSDMDMHGIFYASGPDFKESYLGESKENIHIFPLILRILGLENQYTIDGNLEKIKEVLK